MIGIIIQARTGSKRFPNKIYEDINGKTTLYRVLEGCTSAIIPHKIILAMPQYDKDIFMEKYHNAEFFGAIDYRFNIYFGDPDNLVDRYFNAARDNGISIVVRITADCPLIQGKIIDEMLCKYLKEGYNGFLGNNHLVSPVPYPDGTDVEIFPYWMLAETQQLTTDPMHLEHVTPYMYRRGTQYKIESFENVRPNTMISTKFSDFSFDTPEDLLIINSIVKFYDKYKDLNLAISEAYDIYKDGL